MEWLYRNYFKCGNPDPCICWTDAACTLSERVNNLPKEICSGKIRKYTIHMVRAVKLIFVLSLLFTSICDVAGVQINKGYSLVTVA